MKGSNGARFATALIVALITLIGFMAGMSTIICDRFDPFDHSLTNEERNVDTSMCNISSSFGLRGFGHISGDSLIFGTLIADAVVIGVYQFFGKSKENK